MIAAASPTEEGLGTVPAARKSADIVFPVALSIA
jgi:hypothetical protein